MTYTLRYEEVGENEGMVYHLGNVNGSTPCGAEPTAPMYVEMHAAEALRLLLMDVAYEEERWCPECIAVLAHALTARAPRARPPRGA